MTSLQQRSAPAPRHLALLTGASVLSVLPFAVGLLLPFYVNGLHRLPPAEVTSGRYEPRLMWPTGTGWQGWVDAAVLLAFSCALPALILTTGLAAWGAVRAGRAGRAIALGFATLALACGTALAWLMGPTGTTLVQWRMD